MSEEDKKDSPHKKDSPRLNLIRCVTEWWSKRRVAPPAVKKPRASAKSEPLLSASTRKWIFALVVGVLSRTIPGEIFKWLLWALCIVLGALFFFHYTLRWWKWLRVLVVCASVLGFLYFAVPAIYAAFQPTFAVIKPISPVAGRNNMFLVRIIGHEVLYDVEFVLEDDDRMDALQRPGLQPEVGRQLLAQATRTLKFPELDPGDPISMNELVPVSPLIPDNQNYKVRISFRGVPRPIFSEEIHAVRVGINWDYAVRVIDLINGPVVLECRDSGFPSGPQWKADLPDCPQAFRPPARKKVGSAAEEARKFWLSPSH